MSNIGNYAKLELEILEKVNGDASILPFKRELIALADAFGNSGQSGGSAPYVAVALSQAVKKLLLFEPITEVTGVEEEWSENSIDESGILQNRRCSALFRYPNGEHRYINAVVFKGEKKYDTFTGQVYTDRTFSERVGSSQIVKSFPFKPKTFYLDVEYTPIEKKSAEELNLHYIENGDGSCHVSVLKNKKQLEVVGKYYNLKLYKNG